ncbi:alkylmercury lyase family protein (plasmid) [Streptomyces sp. NBC_00841]|uniref:alkylmercury lyase family protein n=1 Tax=Streptomyces sp. NBC_00841 TaxID=2975847 RepID=UPI002DDC5FD0|nr:alkylmercury lyase family protein [Streptomyces sp. NBC_00841]WSA05794.1 alkylmercury lyase family protein [Streptomyces sp. NBC_00841]
MRITILAVPHCPNVPVVRERITTALAGRSAEVELVEVREEAEAARWGMTGSPTVLLDGVDPFAMASAPASVSCRLYRDADGRADGAPSIQALRQALGIQAAEGQECRTADLLDPVRRFGRGRRAPAERGLRAIHQAVLRHFAAEGAAPDSTALDPTAAVAGRTAADVLAELDREDFLTLDTAGRIRAAYPFSAVRTRHRVSLASGAQVWSMCAVDALGISAMLGGQDVQISSCDPVNDQPVTITFTGGSTHWEPTDAVVFIGRRDADGPAAAVCCDALNFFTGRASAQQWQQAHPEISGQVVSQDRALQIGQQTFGPILHNEHSGDR